MGRVSLDRFVRKPKHYPWHASCWSKHGYSHAVSCSCRTKIIVPLASPNSPAHLVNYSDKELGREATEDIRVFGMSPQSALLKRSSAPKLYVAF